MCAGKYRALNTFHDTRAHAPPSPVAFVAVLPFSRLSPVDLSTYRKRGHAAALETSLLRHRSNSYELSSLPSKRGCSWPLSMIKAYEDKEHKCGSNNRAENFFTNIENFSHQTNF